MASIDRRQSNRVLVGEYRDSKYKPGVVNLSVSQSKKKKHHKRVMVFARGCAIIDFGQNEFHSSCSMDNVNALKS